MITTQIIQLALALVLGAFIGLERNFAGKTAGMRTYGLVAMGATLFIVASKEVVMETGLFTETDLLRTVAAIITGIGFLGAGLIIMKENNVSGLTTAAGLWVSCGVGIAVGLGLYSLALAAALFTILVFTLLWQIEDRLKRAYEKRSGTQNIQG